MADLFKTTKITQNPGGPLTQQLVGAVQTSGGAADAGKVVLLNSAGQLDPSMGGGGGGSGFPVSTPQLVITGGSLTVTGTGVIEATELATNTATPVAINTSAPVHAGQLLISQPGNASAVWADPMVQGLFPPTTDVNSGGIGGGPIFPVLVGAQDPSNDLQNLRVDASGNLLVVIEQAVTSLSTNVSQWGSVATTLGQKVMASSVPVVIASDQSTITVAGTATDNTTNSTAKLPVMAARANAGSPVWTEGFQVPLSVDLSGNLRVNASGISGVQYIDGTSNIGATGGTGTLALGKNPSNITHALALDGSGNLNVNTQAAVFAAANNTSDPTSAVWIGGSDGTKLQGLLVESTGNPNLRVALYQGGNEVNVSSNRLLVDSSGVTQPVSIAGTVLVSNTTQNYAQGSTTAGEIGPLVQGAVTTNDPSYTTAQTSPLSLTTAGHLRTQDFATSATGIAVPTKAMFVGGIGTDGFLHGLSTDNSGILNVNASFSGTVTPGFVTDRVQSGAITSTQNVAISTYGAASVIFNITGSWTGTISFQSQLADNSWVTATAYPVFTGGASVTSASGNGEWQIPVGGMQAFRVIGATVTSGTATANLEAGAGAYSLFVQQLSASDLNATVVQGNAGTIGQSWFVKVTDGSNVFGTTTAHPFITQDLSDGVPNTTSQPAEALQVAGWDGTHLRVISTDSAGFVNVNAAISGSFTPALTSDRTSTGTITSNQNVLLNTQGTGTTQFNVTGSWTGTLVFEASVDGTNFVAAKVLPRYPTGLPEVTSATANGQWAIATGGLNSFRVRGATVTSGTATIWLEGGAGAQDIQTISLIYDPVSGNVPAVKGSSTVPVAADNSLVVSLSPNSSQFATSTTATTLPGTNPQTIGTSSSAVVNATPSRKEITITNTGTTVIFLGLGQTPTTSSYHVALSGCTVANDGTGSTYTSDIWKGSINAISSVGGGLLNVAELT